MTSCTFVGKQILDKVRLGREQDHVIWDRREKVRGTLEGLVAKVLGNKWAGNRQFINTLMFSEHIVTNASELVENLEILDGLIVVEKQKYESSMNIVEDDSESEVDSEYVKENSDNISSVLKPTLYNEEFPDDSMAKLLDKEVLRLYIKWLVFTRYYLQDCNHHISLKMSLQKEAQDISNTLVDMEPGSEETENVDKVGEEILEEPPEPQNHKKVGQCEHATASSAGAVQQEEENNADKNVEHLAMTTNIAKKKSMNGEGSSGKIERFDMIKIGLPETHIDLPEVTGTPASPNKESGLVGASHAVGKAIIDILESIGWHADQATVIQDLVALVQPDQRAVNPNRFNKVKMGVFVTNQETKGSGKVEIEIGVQNHVGEKWFSDGTCGILMKMIMRPMPSMPRSSTSLLGLFPVSRVGAREKSFRKFTNQKFTP